MSADRQAIAAALEHANVPALLVTLVHLTGNLALLDGPLRPRSVWGDPQMGLTDEQQAEVRLRALPAIAALGDEGAAPRFRPTPAQVHDMASFLVGQSVGDDYLEFLLREVGLEPHPTGAEGFESIAPEKRAGFHVVIVGAGMSGILAAYRMGQAGLSCTVIEKNADVGGTWLENTYPGCRVDTPNHSYSYSFAPRDWPQFFSSQPVLLDYFQDCATRLGIRHRIRFSTEVERLVFDEQEQVWAVHTRAVDSGATGTLRANAVISAVGQLNRPRLPAIPGREAFRGPSFHTARWDHGVALAGKRIAVIGTGASAFQAVPRIAPGAAEVFLFQRSPPWVNPRPDYHRDVPEGKHWLLNHLPHYARWYRLLQFWMSSEGALDYIYADDGWDEPGSIGKANRKLRRNLERHARKHLGEHPELLAKCIPDYPPGGKRMLYDDGTWFDTLKRPNVHLVTDPISRMSERGPVTAAGDRFAADTVIYATGFRTTDMLYPMQVIGRGGTDLRASWQGSPRAYRGVTMPGFPNLFCLYGPNTNVVVNTSIIILSECEVDYILSCLRLLLDRGSGSLECRQEVHDAYNEWIDAGNARTAWGAPGVRSWYRHKDGRVSQNWPFRLLDFWKQTRAADAADYLFR